MKHWPDMPIISKEEAERDPHPKQARIVVPTKEQVDAILERIHRGNRCGECQFFDHAQGQAELKKQEVFETAFGALEHDPAWYGRTDIYGLCDQWEGHMTTSISPCVVPNQFLDATIPYNCRDNPVDCPHFKKKTGSGGSRKHYVGKRRNYEE